ncbi:MAG: transglutaminase domain-containing protein [Deltaproteobacteria bacterium]|nr:transglutaminase domain-containing protein [Deltaproteobacteria bacterium]
MKKSNIYIIAPCICLVVIGVIVLIILMKPRLAQPSYPVSRHIRYAFTLNNKTNSVIKNAGFRACAPVSRTATQKCSGLYSSHPYRLITDDLGNHVLNFSFKDIPPFATKIISIKADLLLSDIANPIAVTDLKPFLRPERYIESDDPDICRLARKLKVNATSPVKTAENIFHWVAGNVQYSGYLKNARGALYALKNKMGDCTEFMYLFVALCRASKIPARCIGGYVCLEDRILNPGDYHNWAEFYEDGLWRIVDPQNKIFMKSQSNYIAMKIIEESPDNPMPQFGRFRVKGSGLEARMN